MQMNPLNLHQLFLLLLCLTASFAFADKKPEMKISEISEGVFVHTSFEHYPGWGFVPSNGLVVFMEERAYIIDTPSTAPDTEILVTWIRSKGATIEASISTHFHTDSTAGVAFLNEQRIPTYATELTNSIIKTINGEVTQHTLHHEQSWFEGNNIEVFYPGGGHTQDNVVVWLPKQKILFGGCLVKARSLGNLEDAAVNEWAATMETLQQRYTDADIVIPGHGKSGGYSLLATTQKLVEEKTGSK